MDYFLNVIEVGEQKLSDIRCGESEKGVKLSFTTPDRRNVTVSFAKEGRLSGRIRIESGGKILLDEQLTGKIQKQGGYLF